MERKIVVYDLETIINLFTACFYDVTSKTKKQFIIYDDIEELKELIRFLNRIRRHEYTLLGFNSIAFDSQILEYILQTYPVWFADSLTIEQIVRRIYDEAQRVIHLPDATKYLDLIPEWKLSIPQVDLFKQKHFDGKAKMGTSLKWIQFTMRYPNIEEMPISHDHVVKKNEIEDVMSYNWNDVDSTAGFFDKIKFETELRDTLSERYDLPLLNASEPRLAKMIFAKFLCEEMGIGYKELKDMRTPRSMVALKDVIFPYVKFETKELNDVFDIVKSQKIVVGNEEGKGSKFEHIFNYGGIETVLALGGIHACTEPGVYESSEELIIEDIDVVSFYPNLAIENDVKPKHLGDSFNKVYKSIFEERKKIPKSDPINYVYKIILNSTYGLSKEANSYLYDPFFTYSITINGQLSLLMLIERLVQSIPSLTILQENTDGVTIRYNHRYRGLVSSICTEWKLITKLELEHAFYKKMVIRDVNNYMAIKEGFDWDKYQEHVKAGTRKKYEYIKHKGTFELEIEFHKNPSFRIIPMAAEAHFIGGIDYDTFIKQHADMYDFCGGVKKKSNFDLNLYILKKDEVKVEDIPEYLENRGWTEYYDYWVKKEWIESGKPYEKRAVDMFQAYELQRQSSVYAEPQQKVTRYYISTDGSSLVKDFHDGRRVQVHTGQRVKILNKVEDNNALNYTNIDYGFYVKEAEKLIKSVEKTQLKLF